MILVARKVDGPSGQVRVRRDHTHITNGPRGIRVKLSHTYITVVRHLGAWIDVETREPVEWIIGVAADSAV